MQIEFTQTQIEISISSLKLQKLDSSLLKPVPKKNDENGSVTAPGVSTDVPVSHCLDFDLAGDSPMELDFGPMLST